MNTDVLTTIDGHIAVVTLNRPASMNALNISMRQELLGEMQSLGRRSDVRVVVLTGAGKAFCAGTDLKEAASSADQSPRRTAHTLLHDFQPLIECVSRMDKIVIAAVNGAAAGVGMSLAMACDLLVMADSAYMNSPFAGIGLIPDGGLSWVLTRLLGYPRALELMIEGERIPASRCLELGLVNRVTPLGETLDAARAWAARLAERAPLALALTKRSARLAMGTGLSESMTIEAELQGVCASSADTKEAITAFREKRPAKFTGS